MSSKNRFETSPVQVSTFNPRRKCQQPNSLLPRVPSRFKANVNQASAVDTCQQQTSRTRPPCTAFRPKKKDVLENRIKDCGEGRTEYDDNQDRGWNMLQSPTSVPHNSTVHASDCSGKRRNNFFVAGVSRKGSGFSVWGSDPVVGSLVLAPCTNQVHAATWPGRWIRRTVDGQQVLLTA